MRGESMKDKSKKSTYSTTFGVDPLKSRYFKGIAGMLAQKNTATVELLRNCKSLQIPSNF